MEDKNLTLKIGLDLASFLLKNSPDKSHFHIRKHESSNENYLVLEATGTMYDRNCGFTLTYSKRPEYASHAYVFLGDIHNHDDIVPQNNLAHMFPLMCS